MFLCNYTQYNKHCDLKNTFLWNWTQHPSSSATRSSWKLRISSENAAVDKECFVSNVKPCTKSFCQGKRGWILRCSLWLNAFLGPFLGPYFFFFTFILKSTAFWKLHLWVSQLHSSLFLYLKERWWVGGGQVWGKANSEGLNTQSKHYPMFELHTFGSTVLPHTRTLPSESYSC